MTQPEPYNIVVESGVSAVTGEAFCAVRVNGERVGQLTPSEVREMALGWLRAAEAAEQDAVVAKMLREVMQLDEDLTAGFIIQMRELRANDEETQ